MAAARRRDLIASAARDGTTRAGHCCAAPFFPTLSAFDADYADASYDDI